LPVALAWDAFRQANGAGTLAEVKARIGQYRHQPTGLLDNPAIGCILLAEPFFFPQKDWIDVPPDFAKNIVQGKTYSTDTETGKQLYEQVADRLRRTTEESSRTPAVEAVVQGPRYGAPRPVAPRLGQGTFRALVTEAYARRCAVTGERTLPVLEAAHIRPYGTGGEHALGNGLMLRSDLHRLYDGGYVTVDPDERRLLVSRRIREEFENGRHYYALEGQRIAAPQKGFAPPDTNNLRYHAEQIYRG
jgi:putative restriction endonuclease